MKDCTRCEKLFDKALYNELSPSEKEFFNSHIAVCGECSANYSGMLHTLELVKSSEREEPAEGFMENFWDELEPKLSTDKKIKAVSKFNWQNVLGFNFPLPYKLAGVALILILGIFIGRFWTTGGGIGNSQAITGNGNSRNSLNVETARYLERSKILLLGIMNFNPATDDAETISLPHIQKISRELVGEAPALKSRLKENSRQQLSKLVSDLQLILMQIANMEKKNDIDGIELVKAGVNSSGIFLKINIQQLQQFGNDKSNTKIENKKI